MIMTQTPEQVLAEWRRRVLSGTRGLPPEQIETIAWQCAQLEFHMVNPHPSVWHVVSEELKQLDRCACWACDMQRKRARRMQG